MIYTSNGPWPQKVITNPVTGKSETVDDIDAVFVESELQRTRRELRDMLSGNTQFHTDNLGQAPADTEKQS